MAPKVLFLYNEHLATEALLGEAFVEQGFDIEVFEVVPPQRIDDPAVDVTFPDPTGYDVVVPLGARWPVYDDALRRTWVSAEMQLVRDAADAGVALLGVCFGGQLLAQAFGGSVARSSSPEIGWYDVASDRPEVIPGGRGSSGTSTGGHCRRERPRSPAPRPHRRRSCSAVRSRCSSTRRSITTCWSCGWPMTTTTRSSASDSLTTNYVPAQQNYPVAHRHGCATLSVVS